MCGTLNRRPCLNMISLTYMATFDCQQPVITHNSQVRVARTVQQFPSNRDRSILFLQDYLSLLYPLVLISPKLFNDNQFLHSLRKSNGLQWQNKNQSI